MPDTDTTRVEDAWRAASPADIVHALRELDQYSDDVRAIIKCEAARRELRADTTAVLDKANPWRSSPVVHALARAAERLHRPVRDSPLRFATGLGIVYWAVTFVQDRYFTPSGGATPLPYSMPLLLVLAMFVICAPYRTYRTAALVPVVAVAALWTLWTITLAAVLVARGQAADLPPIGLLLTALLVPWPAFCGVPMVLLLLTTCIRRRKWPVYTPGYCRVCDYNLHGLVEPRCPECGDGVRLRRGGVMKRRRDSGENAARIQSLTHSRRNPFLHLAESAHRLQFVINGRAELGRYHPRILSP